MARQPKTRQPKAKFKEAGIPKCTACGADKFLYQTKSGAAWQCSSNITH